MNIVKVNCTRNTDSISGWQLLHYGATLNEFVTFELFMAVSIKIILAFAAI